MPTANPAARRGNRSNPGRDNRLFWVLCQLCDCYERIITSHIQFESPYRLVDYGCGNMPYRSMFGGAEYIGTDFPGNELADLYLLENGSLPIEDGCAEVVLSSQVLEHVADVPLYLAECHRVLSCEGLLLLSTHGCWKYHPDPDDYWRWTCDGLRSIVSDSGFEVIDFQGILGPEATALQLLQDATFKRIPQSLRRHYFRYMQWRIRRADQRCDVDSRNRDACVYLLVARKRPLPNPA